MNKATVKVLINDRKKNTFIEEHRKKQLIEIAIETIATLGLKEASFANIAKNAGITKGVIVYYFTSRDDLIEQIMKSIQNEVRTVIRNRLNKDMNALERLLTYASSFFCFAEENRNKYTAFTELWTTISTKKEANPYGAIAYDECRSYIGKILTDGKKRNELKISDITTASAVIQAIIDGLIIQWTLSPGKVDLKKCEHSAIELIKHYVMSDF